MKAILLSLLLAGSVVASCEAQQSAQDHLDQANQLEDHGKPTAAIAEARQALEMKCAHPASAYFVIGEAQYDQGDKDGSMASMEEATKLNPDFAAAYANIGIIFSEKGDMDGAIAAYRKSLNAKDNTLVRNYLGIAYGEKGDFKSAIVEFRHVIAQKPGDADFHDNLAHALREDGDYEGAAVEYREELRLNPSSESARQNLNKVLAVLQYH